MLLQRLKNKPFCNDLHYFLIAVVILFISFKFYYFFILLFIYLLFIYKKTKLLFPIVILLCLISVRYTFTTIEYNKTDPDILEGTVVEKEEKYIVLKSNNTKYLLYTYKDIKIGDNLLCSVKYNDFSSVSYDGDFNYQEYLYAEGIKRTGNIIKYEVKSSSFNTNLLKYNILSSLKEKLGNNTFLYVEALVFGENNLSTDLKEGYSMLGLAHILAISGLHIFLISKFLDYIIFKIFRIPNSNIPILLIGIYTVILGFKASIARAFLFLLLGKLNNTGQIKYTKLDILSISFTLILFIRPYMFYQSGFLLTFLVSFILIFMSEFIYSKNKIKKLYLTHIIIYLVTLPLTLSFYNKISLFSIIIGPVLSAGLIYIILPLSFISCFINLSIIEIIFRTINDFILGLIKYNQTITLQSFNVYLCIIYYVLLILILIKLSNRQKPYLFIVLITFFFIIVVNLKALNPYNNVTFIDCGQGDSALIELEKGKGNILIDTYNSYDYIKSKGINHLNYVVITHSDRDHLGDLDKIISDIKVDHVIYPDSDEILASYDLPYFLGVNSKYGFKVNGVYFDFISPTKDFGNVNDNSLVLKFTLDRLTYLFCGDISTVVEEVLVNLDVDLTCDVLKVAHHGSITSSSLEFLYLCDPKYSIISCGKDNKYNFPNEEVVKRLKIISKIYITHQCGNITFRVNKNKLEVLTYY